jgi:integrase
VAIRQSALKRNTEANIQITGSLATKTETSRPVDFHSTRRAYATGLARANVNAQTAQVLSGHSDAKVHQRYVAAATITALPEAAAPDLSAVTLVRDPQKSKATAFTKAFSVGARRFELPTP